MAAVCGGSAAKFTAAPIPALGSRHDDPADFPGRVAAWRCGSRQVPTAQWEKWRRLTKHQPCIQRHSFAPPFRNGASTTPNSLSPLRAVYPADDDHHVFFSAPTLRFCRRRPCWRFSDPRRGFRILCDTAPTIPESESDTSTRDPPPDEPSLTAAIAHHVRII